MKVLFVIIFVVGLMFTSFADGKEDKGPVAEPKPVAVIFSGNVLDEVTGEALVGVEIKLEGTNKKAYTDFDGNFTFEDVVPGEYNIVTNYVSYEKSKIEKQTIDVLESEVSLKLQPVQ